MLELGKNGDNKTRNTFPSATPHNLKCPVFVMTLTVLNSNNFNSEMSFTWSPRNRESVHSAMKRHWQSYFSVVKKS